MHCVAFMRWAKWVVGPSCVRVGALGPYGLGLRLNGPWSLYGLDKLDGTDITSFNLKDEYVHFKFSIKKHAH